MAKMSNHIGPLNWVPDLVAVAAGNGAPTLATDGIETPSGYTNLYSLFKAVKSASQSFIAWGYDGTQWVSLATFTLGEANSQSDPFLAICQYERLYTEYTAGTGTATTYWGFFE